MTIGQRVEDLDTPSLLLDAQASQRNLERMASFFRDRPCKLRPHFKNHKCTELARRQLEAGSAVGITCAKLGEAEVLAKHGFDDVLIANQVVGARKIERLIDVAKRIRVQVAVDDIEQARALSQAASSGGCTIGVLVEVDIGMGRCGLPPGEPALALAREVTPLPGLRFGGLQAYEGNAVYIDDAEERARRARDSMALAVETRRMIEAAGIEVDAISGGSTSTFRTTGQMDGVDEVQAGTYATMDWRYHQLISEFEIALSVLTRVISRRPGEAVLDVGVKGAGDEFGVPRIRGYPAVEIPCFSAEEHVVVKNAPTWKMGEPLELLPSHACTTCNLYREIYVHQDGKVVDVWPIEASGKLA